MIPLPLAWTLLTVWLWTSGSSQILQKDPVEVLYPMILSKQTLDCDCENISCNIVYWFHSSSTHSRVRFLGNCNNADRAVYGNGVDTTRFRLSRKNSMSFTLHISDVTEEDAGIYSCVLKDKRNTEVWKPGVLLRPGVIPPTLPPTTKPKPTAVTSTCCCSEKKNDSSQSGCGSLVLWPSVGLIAALALALICTLYYFSRLPRKCRHHFVKKR